MHLAWLLIAASLAWEGKVHFTHNPPSIVSVGRLQFFALT